MMWMDGVETVPVDSHAAFRGAFELTAPAQVEVRHLGASWYVIRLDGRLLAEGPPRFTPACPQYQTNRVELAAGRHVLAVQVHHEGVTTRLLEQMPPFLHCVVMAAGRPLPVRWKAQHLAGYASQVRRISPILGWVEWCDTRANPADWQQCDFDDSAWKVPVETTTQLGDMTALDCGATLFEPHNLTPLAKGPLAEVFGYERDDISTRFFLRDLTCDKLPAEGQWRRYDLGRMRLGRPRFVLDLPAGAVVEFACCESLSHGRVGPWYSLSLGPTCTLDHYIARGGRQEFMPLTPKGGRFLEVHVLAPPDQVQFVSEQFVERAYHGRPQGEFECEDPLLNRIWSAGIETYRACAEDALVDCPTRERGQWAGDVVSVGLDIAAAGYGDLRLARRALLQCGQCAREDGLVAGLCPGSVHHMSTYAAQWISAAVHYWELTGDLDLLRQLRPFADRNIEAFEKFNSDDGLRDEIGWGFVDWGYVRGDDPTDMSLNLHYLAALRDMQRWCRALDDADGDGRYQKLEKKMHAVISAWLQRRRIGERPDWEQIGYHRAVLAMRQGYFTERDAIQGLEFIKRHLLNCFPNDPAAPRLAHPGLCEKRLITPYFAHYVFPLLIERGQMDFVLDQYRTCWGWMLDGGFTTLLEVFDTRWSHCHQWSGCPTWQLSRYVLGLNPRHDLRPRHYELCLTPGSLQHARGRVPLPEGGEIAINWRRTGAERIEYAIESPAPLTLSVAGGELNIEGKCRLNLSLRGATWIVAG